MKRWRKWLPWLLLAAAFLVLPWISGWLDARAGARRFREFYTRVPGRRMVIVLSNYEIANLLGGHAGLTRLAAFSKDSSLVPVGRMMAAEAQAYIESGSYARELESSNATSSIFKAPLDKSYLWGLQFREAVLSIGASQPVGPSP